MIRSLRWFLSGVIVGALGAWWWLPRWQDAQALIAAANRWDRFMGGTDGDKTAGA